MVWTHPYHFSYNHRTGITVKTMYMNYIRFDFIYYITNF